MAFLPLFSGKAYPRGKHHETVTLMEYIDNFDKNHPRPARKYCYIVKCGDLQKIFANVGITLTEERRVKRSFWNRRHPVEGKEYGVEICEDDNGDPKNCCNPVYIVYRKHWLCRNTETQVTIYASAITPKQAISLDNQLRNHDISG